VAATRTEVRQGVGRKTGDLTLLVATHDAASTDTFRDTVHLGDRGDNAPSLLNRIGYFSGGTAANLGHEARIQSFTSSSRTLTFTPAATSTPVIGDTLELWSIADRVGGISDLHGHINDAIRAVRNVVGVEVYDDTAVYRPSTSATIAIPDGWQELGGIEWADRQGNLYDVPKSQVLVRLGRRTVEIKGRALSLAANRPVTLWGYDRAALLEADDDETTVDFEWLVETVASALSLAPSWKATDRAAEERRANFWAARAGDFRRKVGAQRRGFGISLP
jgi:hypothetical protein